jgi:hypothetical protein
MNHSGCWPNPLNIIYRTSLDSIDRYENDRNGTLSWRIVNNITLDLKTGFNIFTETEFGSNIEIKRNYVLGWGTGDSIFSKIGRIGMVQSVRTDYTMNNANGVLSPINSTQKLRFYMSATMSKASLSSFFYEYKTGNTAYNIRLKTENSLGQSLSETRQVNVVQGITFLTVNSSAELVCRLNQACNLIASYSGGIPLYYLWTLNGTTYNTTQNSLSLTFSQYEKLLLVLTAVNSVNTRRYFVNVSGLSLLSGFRLYSGTNPSKSSSSISKNAEFILTYQSGNEFKCSINYGDGSPLEIYVENQNFNNNSIIEHAYLNTSNFTVTIQCRNQLNSITYSMVHSVQEPITGVQLDSQGALKDQLFRIPFSIKTGTDVRISFRFDGVQDTDILFDPIKKLGNSSSRTLRTLGIRNVLILIENDVSSAILNTTFEIVVKITTPNVTVLTNPIKNNSIYLFQDEFIVSIWIAEGFNIYLDAFFEDTLGGSISMFKSGTWNGTVNDSIVLNYTFTNPGTHVFTLKVYNSMSFHLINLNCTIMSKCDGLYAHVNDLSKILINGETDTDFRMSYVNNNKACSHGILYFWPGDASNRTYGPFDLGMDFYENINKVSFKYSYLLSGNYVARFLAQNALSSKYFSLSMDIKDGIDGFVTFLNPGHVTPGKNVSIDAYLSYGENVVFKWNISGTVFTRPRQCKFILFKIYLKSLNSSKLI